ncbi:DUF6058 family natural product biosynthesis protein [Kordia sp.]|uniref:DUF6058 family natural product biosynthesis protein n=1 Tax=Kordia sp. TaxID=1965332 RepID=UPI003B58C1C6
MNKDIKYIIENFIDAEELCRITNISNDTLDQLITKKMIPNFSYKIETESTISSPLGDREVIIDVKKYFPRSTINLVLQNLNLDEVDSFKQKIKNEFINAFCKHDDKSFAYGNNILENGKVNLQKLEEAFEVEWEYYINGVYGICTLNATGTEIAKKEIAVKKLISFIENNTENELTAEKKQELLQLNLQYNEISNLFSPYQRKSSSRGKYLDEILQKHDLKELIKNYN